MFTRRSAAWSLKMDVSSQPPTVARFLSAMRNTSLEKKLADVALAGSTAYTTLEPCTSRNHPKVPCTTRLAGRKVARVVIGMLDPDDGISGRGQRTLRKPGIATELFDHDLMTKGEEGSRPSDTNHYSTASDRASRHGIRTFDLMFSPQHGCFPLLAPAVEVVTKAVLKSQIQIGLPLPDHHDGTDLELTGR